MKKNFVLYFLISVILISFSTGSNLFASPKTATCLEAIEKEAMENALPKTNDDTGFSATISNSKLIKQDKKILIYEVEVFLQYCDGASTDEFPAETYMVTATGNEKSCKIKEIKIK